MSFIEQNRTILESFASMSQRVGARNDYVQGGGGNTSVKLPGGLMAIKASGYCLADVQVDAAYAVLNCTALQEFYYNNEPADFEDTEAAGAACTKENTLPVEGMTALRPSVEAGFHSLLDTYVIHTHSIYSNLAACARECAEILKKALAGAQYGYAVVPYTDPGTRLSFVIRDVLSRERVEVLFLENHGVVVHGNDAERCIAVHEDLNRRLASFFHTAFGPMGIKNCPEGFGIPEAEAFYDSQLDVQKALLTDTLFPDQAVFLKGTLSVCEDMCESVQCAFDYKTAMLHYVLSVKRARVIAEVISAVTFIIKNIKESGYTVRTMDENGLNFINNWESEKYRRAISK